MKQPQLARYESGRIPDPAVLAKIARVGGATVDWILTGQTREASVPEPAWRDEPLTWNAALAPTIAGTPLTLVDTKEVFGAKTDRAWKELAEPAREEIRDYLRRVALIAMAIEHELPQKPARTVIDALSEEVTLIVGSKIIEARGTA
jgi:transcriptional regulator with XRE-family HTH domain